MSEKTDRAGEPAIVIRSGWKNAKAAKTKGRVFVQCTVCRDAPYHPLVVPALEWQCPNSDKHPKVPAKEYTVGTKGSDTVMRVK